MLESILFLVIRYVKLQPHHEKLGIVFLLKVI